ncbi:ATPase [Methanothermobacter sp. K4]|uniref:ATPase n=1 Tax=Methanothermobacter sp. K4 TaxID=2913262 RepID=UPI001EDAD0A3|nr:ATPase [Methanothermobacter sp. K4]MCG2829180.1 ATPase [Methanothermobacter sp. K4]
MDADELALIIREVRAEIGHEDMEVHIAEVIFNRERDELLIVAPDRSDKSIIIGKGGWVVGRLREKLGIGSVHVESEIDLLMRRERVKFALERLDELKGSFRKLSLLEKPLRKRLEYPVGLEFLTEESNESSDVIEEPGAAVALSGGTDSSFSLIASFNLGLKPVAFTADPGTIVLPGHVRRAVDELTASLGVRHEYISMDFSEIQMNALEGKFHPCGRCSSLIEEAIMEKIKNEGIDTVIFGDLLSTGYGSLQVTDDILRVNLPALFAASKQELKSAVSSYGVRAPSGFGCPLLGEVHRRYHHMRRYSIQRILRETRAGVLEPGEALELIWSICGSRRTN